VKLLQLYAIDGLLEILISPYRIRIWIKRDYEWKTVDPFIEKVLDKTREKPKERSRKEKSRSLNHE